MLTQVRIVGVPELRARMDAMERIQAVVSRRMVNRLALLMRTFLRDAAPKSGRPHADGSPAMADTIDFTTRGDGTTVEAEFYASPVAKFVIEGTLPHEIRARNGRALAIPVRGGGGASPFGFGSKSAKYQQFAFFTSVQHPGTRANDFRKPAMQRLMGSVELVLSDEAPSLLRGL